MATSVADTTKNATATVSVGALAISPASATVAPSGTQQFSASVQGLSNNTINWSVDKVAGGNSTVGTINSSGLYTAPAQTGTHTITATSATDSSLTGTASVTVANLAVLLSPASVTMIASTTQQFSASVQGASGATINWSVDGVAGGNSTVGTISSSGLYTAPAQAGSHMVTAADSANTTVTASATVDVFVFTISPTSVQLRTSATQQFTATITGLTNTAVSWSVDGVAGGNSTTGTISSTGLYTAPGSNSNHTVTATSVAVPTASVSASVTVGSGSSETAVLTYHNDNTRDGAYLSEVVLTPSNVNSSQFGKLFSYPVDGQVYAQPLYMPQLGIAGGTHDVVFVETQNNSVYAFDATGTIKTPLWQVNLGPSVPKNDTGGVSPNVGILSTPVIDSGSNIIYLVVETSNTGPNGTPFFLYALDVTTGKERIPHVAINATYSGDTMETSCVQRMGLALSPVTGWIYMTFGSCTHGWVLAYDKSSLSQKAVFEDTNGAEGGGFWAGGGAPAIDDNNGNVYVMSGTDYDDNWISPPPAYTQTGFNDSFLNLDPNTLAVQSSFTPNNNWTLSEYDVDLGSGAAILVPGNSQHPKELVGGGKDGNVYVVDPNNMGGFQATNNVLQNIKIAQSQYDNIFSTPAYWNGTIYYHEAQDVVRAFSWNAAAASGQQLSTSSTSNGSANYNSTSHGATASVSANGAMNGIILDIDNSGYQVDGKGSNPCVLHAYDATNLANELYNSSQAGSRDTAGYALKFTVPTIAGGKVFVPTANELDVYGLLP
jgi:hypothetical protein